MTYLKAAKEGQFEFRPGPAALPYQPFRRTITFSLEYNKVTSPVIHTDGSKSEAGYAANPGVTIASDFRSALAAICTPGPAQTALIVEIILALDQAPQVSLCWVKGHSGVAVNELADQAAKTAAISNLEQSYSILPQSLARGRAQSSAMEAWTLVYTQDYHNRKLKIFATSPIRLRAFLSKIRLGMATTTILTSHGQVLEDLALWYRDLDPTCPHGWEESQTVDHLLFSCPDFMLHRLQTALLLGVQDFSPTALPLLADSLPAWNYLGSIPPAGMAPPISLPPQQQQQPMPQQNGPLSPQAMASTFLQQALPPQAPPQQAPPPQGFPPQHQPYLAYGPAPAFPPKATAFTVYNGRSAEDALAKITEFIDSRQSHWRKTLAISLDISKAFDTISRLAIVQSLDRLICPDSLVCLVQSFLEDREVTYSAWPFNASTFSQRGTLQGSSLSPFLWNLVARELFLRFQIRESWLVAFADDFTLLIQVRGRLPVMAINDFLDRMTAWCVDNGLQLNPRKTQACIFQWRRVHPNLDPEIVLRNRCIIPRLSKAIQRKFGLSFVAGNRIFKALVVPAFLYGFSAWGSRGSSREGIRQLRSLQSLFARRTIRGGPCTPTISAISLPGSPPRYIIIKARMTYLKAAKEGQFEFRPGPAALPYQPFRRTITFSLEYNKVTSPVIHTDGSKSEAGYAANPRVTIASDFRSALAAICTPGPAQTALIVEIILALDQAPQVSICWVKGHSGVAGNELADQAPKTEQYITWNNPTPSFLKALLEAVPTHLLCKLGP
ncbi:hypothetical protein LAZ67_21002512 [Cordylochernes scorpioides]|uniref:Reverse transcriptase domain-containing protein n=1 Tax=Cordylochernes scorpioides TaxID=51811 RepID=A0ABY6LN15_9ARAC|nr:hypothetical protein LAZ67_21002512 [Cordylochernes scorpioides]